MAESAKRYVLVETKVSAEAIPDDLREGLVHGNAEGEWVRVYIPHQNADGSSRVLSGGPREVIRKLGKVAGAFRAPAVTSFDQGMKRVPPSQQDLLEEPLD